MVGDLKGWWNNLYYGTVMDLGGLRRALARRCAVEGPTSLQNTNPQTN